jgi:hypothetical protein
VDPTASLITSRPLTIVNGNRISSQFSVANTLPNFVKMARVRSRLVVYEILFAAAFLLGFMTKSACFLVVHKTRILPFAMRRSGVRTPAAPPIKSTSYGEPLLAVFVSVAKLPVFVGND